HKMGRKKNNIKVEYDHTYPPLNQPVQGSNESDKPRQTAFQVVMSQSKNEKSVIIAPKDRRFSDNDGKTEKLLDDLNIRLGIQIKLSITKMGSLVFDTISKDQEFDETAKFIIREAFSAQASKIIHISDKNIKILTDRRFHESLWRKRYLVVRPDFNRGNLSLEGGQKSVQQAEAEIEDYISWNTDSASITLEIPLVFHDFIRGQDFETIKRILIDSGKYVKTNFDENLITLTGSKICVDKAREKILSFYHLLEQNLKRFTLTISQKQQTELQKRFSDNFLSSEDLSVSFYVSPTKQHIMDILGEPEKARKLNENVLSIIRQFKSSKVCYPYWVTKLFSSYSEAQAVLKNYASKFAFDPFPLHEYIEIICDESRMQDATKILGNIISDITADTSYDTLLIPESTVKMLESKDQTKLKTIENSTLTKIFFETDIDKLSIVKPNHLHRYIIGAKGKSLNDYIQKFGPNSNVSFGKEASNLDQCVVKGPQSEATSLASALSSRISDLANIHYKLSVNVPNNIKLSVNNEKDTIAIMLKNIGMLESLTFPSEGTESNQVILIGKKAVVDRCELALKERIATLNLSVTKYMPIPENLLPILKDFGDAVLKAVSNDVGGDIHIQLPKNITTNDKLSFFGISSKVDSALEIFKKLTSKNSTEYYFDMMSVSNQYIDPLRYSIFNIIGSSGVRVYFPHTVVKGDNYTILMIGRSENIKEVKSSITEKLILLANTIEKTITIKAEYKKEFLKKRPDELTLVQKISDECGNARISIGDRNSTSDTITDSKNNVILSISPEYFTSVNENKFEGKCHINVKGLPDDVEKTLLSLNDWKVLTMTVSCPLHVQRNHFSFRSHNFAYLIHDLLVELDLGYIKSPPEEFIVVSGIKSKVEEASKLIETVCDDNYECRVEVDQKYYNRLIGKQGSFIKKFNADNKIRMTIPSGRPDDRDVLVLGKKDNCMIAIEKLLCYIKDWENNIVKEFEFDAQFKFNLIGAENSNIKKIGKELNVSIRLTPSIKRYQLPARCKPPLRFGKNDNPNNNKIDINPPHLATPAILNQKIEETENDSQHNDGSNLDFNNFP
ncbi:hypothetical protein MXB_3207, partial [Myxobolus squamalis]